VPDDPVPDDPVPDDPVLDDLVWHAVPELHRPVLVAAFTGWFDIAGAATAAVRHLGRDDALLAAVDPEGFFDFTIRRPTVSIDEDGRRVVAWPSNEVRRSGITSPSHDLLLLAGEEPGVRWATFAALVVGVCRRLGCELVVTLGTVADTHPHTRAPMVFGSSTDEGLARRLGLSRPRYQGPTGIVGVLHEQLDQAGLPAISLRAPVPHYLAGAPNPRATVALLVHLEHVIGVATAHAALADDIAEWARLHDEAVSADEDAQRYVRQLELTHDRRMESAAQEGSTLAEDLEVYLQERRDREDPDA
jgi:hypothetical protein